MKRQIEQLGNHLVDNAIGATALWLSGGKDSRLLLEVMVDLKMKFDVLRFDDGWTREQRAVVDAIALKHDLGVLRYKPRFVTLFGDGKDLAIAAAYAVGGNGETVTLLRDIVDGSRCAYDVKIDRSERIKPPVRFATHIWGVKKTDRHFSVEGPITTQGEWIIGGSRFVCPLFNWTDEEVISGLRYMGVEYKAPSEDLDTGNISACTACMRGQGRVFCPKEGKDIDSLDWDPVGQMNDWQKINGVGVSDG